ncbi:arginine--tRNA ligase [Thermogemmatispora onikobensis]|uniref:arginine--tRNA ligase n=1 Tax=Thermogemmatispora onikobensis TaxID=732234 RepID=UPI0008529272|nr:arginine--tRNA ligase [Thermogemmatispora onikobensis]
MTTSTEAQETAEAAPRDLHEYLSALVRKAARSYLAREQIDYPVEELPIDLGFSAQASFGDYSVPLMSWAAKNRLGRPPLVIAEALADYLRSLNLATLQEVTATRPGYLNFRLNRPLVSRDIMVRVLEAGPDFGQSETGVGTKVVVEHTNINSNKAAHVGHLRNSCLGDTLARMLRTQGYQVEAQNYIDDTGVQVADVVVGFALLKEGRLHLPDGDEPLPGEPFDYYCSRVYVAVGKAYDEQPELLERRRAVLQAIERGSEAATGQSEEGTDYAALAADLSQRIVQAHLKTMSRLNISYDLLTWESAILHSGLWKKTFEVLKNRGLLRRPESGKLAGCWILPFGENESQDEESEHTLDKVLVKSDGTATYTAKDIAYQLWKFGLTDDPAFDVHFTFVPWGRQHDGRLLWTMRTPALREEASSEGDPLRFGHAQRVINVIDVRQSYAQQVVYESLRRLGYEEQAKNSTHLAYEIVTLSAATAASLGIDTSDGREFYPMSGRKGLEIKADDLINAAIARMKEVKPDLPDETAAILGASAIRYFMIRFSLQQVIALDMEEVLRPTGDTGVYLQYAYARANSILRRLQESGYEVAEQLEELPSALEQSEWELLRHIDAYPRRLAEATSHLAPNLLAAYAYDLAAHFSDFYEHTPPIVKEEDQRVKAFRAWIVRTTAQVMNNVLRTLGFIPLERV